MGGGTSDRSRIADVSTTLLWGGRNAGATRKHFGWGTEANRERGPPPEASPLRVDASTTAWSGRSPTTSKGVVGVKLVRRFCHRVRRHRVRPDPHRPRLALPHHHWISVLERKFREPPKEPEPLSFFKAG